jgi:hypothetical protein
MRRDDICLYLGPNDRAQVQALLTDRNTARKVVWRSEIVLATADYCGTARDHAAREDVQAHRLALVGALPGRRPRRPPERQDAAVARAAAATGNPPQGDCKNCAEDPTERHPLAPLEHGRGGRHFPFQASGASGRKQG